MTSPSPNIEELVTYLVTSLVDTPEAVVISTEVDEHNVRITITADPADVGKIIGRSGRTIKSIRTLARAAASNTPYIVEVDVEG